MARKLTDFWLEHPTLDLPTTAVVGYCLALLGPQHLIEASDRAAFYQTLSAVSGGLLALGSISVTVVFTVTAAPKLQLVLDLVGHRLRRLIFSALSGLVLTTVGAMLLFLADGAPHSTRIGLTASCGTLMALSFLRLWWLFGLTLRSLVPVKALARPETSWQAPDIGEGDYQLPLTAPGRQESPDQ